MADKIQIRKGSVDETSIVPLYQRKLCAEQFPTLQQDPYATKICERLNYDFSQFQGKEKRVFYQYGALEGAMREKDMGDYGLSEDTSPSDCRKSQLRIKYDVEKG